MLGDVGPWIRARDWRIGPLNEDPPAREIGQSVNDLDNLTFIPFLLSLSFSLPPTLSGLPTWLDLNQHMSLLSLELNPQSVPYMEPQEVGIDGEVATGFGWSSSYFLILMNHFLIHCKYINFK